MLNNKGGRPTIPAKIKELSGTIRKDRPQKGIDFALISEVPKAEVWLDTKAKKYFKNICELLIRKQLLNEANVPLVLIMAQEFATYESACRELKNTSDYVTSSNSGAKHQSPWVSIRNNARKNYHDIASLFGLDPISSLKFPSSKKEDADPFDALTKKYNNG